MHFDISFLSLEKVREFLDCLLHDVTVPFGAEMLVTATR